MQQVLEAGLTPRRCFFACILKKRLRDGEVSTRRSDENCHGDREGRETPALSCALLCVYDR